MPIYGKKNFNSAKTTRYYGPQKSKGFVCLFTIFTKKSLLSRPYFAKKRPFSEKQTVLFPYFVKICQFSQKHRDLMSFYSNFSCVTPCWDAHIWSKTSIRSKLLYIIVEIKNRLSEEWELEHLWQVLGSKSQFIIGMDVFSTKYGHENIVL